MVAAALTSVAIAACGSAARYSQGATVRGESFRLTLAPGWSASSPQDVQGGTAYPISGPNHAGLEIIAFPPDAPFFAGGDVTDTDLTTLLQASGHITGTTVVDVAPPSSTTVAKVPAMQFNATLLGSDGRTRSQSETIDTRYGSYLYYIIYASDQASFPATDSAAHKMLATWQWAALPPAPSATAPGACPGSGVSCAGTSPPTATPTSAASPTSDASSVTSASLSLTSQPGDYVGQGQSRQYAAPGDIFQFYSTSYSAPPTTSGFRVHVSASDGESWTVEIDPPRGQSLHLGSYQAVRIPAPGASEATLDVSGDGRGCNNSYSSFDITVLQADSSGVVTAVDVSFTQHCEQPAAPALTGRVWVKANA